MNSAKAGMSVRISSANEVVERFDVGGGQYSFEAARLNPNMTVPFMEVEDKVITDSRLIADHLFQNNPGAGDRKVQAMGKTKELNSFVDLVAAWDEGAWCYSQMGDGAQMGNQMRFVTLHKNALLAAKEGSNLPLVDGMTMEDVYCRKIGLLRVFAKMSSSDPAAADFQKQNIVCFEQIWERANELLNAQTEDSFLFGEELTTADAFLVPFMYRVEFISKKILEEHFNTYPRMRKYWQRVQATDESKSVTAFGKAYLGKMMLSECMPFKILFFKLGFLKIHPLTEDMERKVSASIEQKKREMGA